MVKVGIIGATGYAGQQLVWILNGHKKVEIEFISSYSNAGENMGDVYANYKKYFEKKLISQEEAEDRLDKIDVLFLALPHGHSAPLAEELGPETLIVDCGADFRLTDAAAWQRFNGSPHAGSWPYGLPE